MQIRFRKNLRVLLSLVVFITSPVVVTKFLAKATALREEVWEGSVYLGGKGITRAWGCTLSDQKEG